MNYLNTHALVPTSLRDEIVNLYNVQMTMALSKKLDQLRLTVSEEELGKIEKKESEELAHRFGDRIGKILNIIDPRHGDVWKEKVLALRWDSESFATLEKLNLIALSDVAIDSKILWLSLLEANKATKTLFHLQRGDHLYRYWIRRELLLEKVGRTGDTILKDFIDIPGGLLLPEDFTLANYYMEVKMEKRKPLFPLESRGEIREKGVLNKAQRIPELLQKAGQRLVYRYFIALKSKEHINSIPIFARKWVDLNDETTCMYPVEMQGLTPWEVENCPWWIDLEKGHILANEKELWIKHGGDKEKGAEKARVEKESVDVREKGKAKIQDESDTLKKNHISVSESLDGGLEYEHEEGVDVVGSSLSLKARKSMLFVHKPWVAENGLRCSDSLSIVGDYVLIGKDFAEGKKNKVYSQIHEHVLKHRVGCTKYTKKGRQVKWAADFVFLDFPYGHDLHGSSINPAWDELSDDHVRYGISLSSAALSDFAWMLIMGSTGGEIMGLVERYCRVLGLDIFRRIIVMHHTPYGSMTHSSSTTEYMTSMIWLAHRHGLVPPVFLRESNSRFEALGNKPQDSVIHTARSSTTTYTGRDDDDEIDPLGGVTPYD
ncbi:hypothetical protein GOP47_0029276 [Adiantum capillus-veneris]|nr:hypothetical protein GOP47_0029276 [Adiantum capillus-veneris]